MHSECFITASVRVFHYERVDWVKLSHMSIWFNPPFSDPENFKSRNTLFHVSFSYLLGSYYSTQGIFSCIFQTF